MPKFKKKAKAKIKVRKRGVKPGSKRGRYKRSKSSLEIIKMALDKTGRWKVSENQVGSSDPSIEVKTFTPSPLSLCGQLEDAILLLETRISNAIAKINSLM